MSKTPSTARAQVAAIGIGASAGGLTPLTAIIGGLPSDLPAAVFAVLHLAAGATSVLPQILQRATALDVVPARDGAPVRAGTVLVAPPDRHLVVEVAGDEVVVRLVGRAGDRGHRPAIDPLLRSLAVAYGERAIGVILSGALDDGAEGLAQLHAAGGATFVQHPDDCEHPSMPASAMAATTVDGALPAAALPAALVRATADALSASTTRKEIA